MLMFLLHGDTRNLLLHLRITRLMTLNSLLCRFVRWVSCHSVLLYGGENVTEVCNGTEKCAISKARGTIRCLRQTAYSTSKNNFVRKCFALFSHYQVGDFELVKLHLRVPNFMNAVPLRRENCGRACN